MKRIVWSSLCLLMMLSPAWADNIALMWTTTAPAKSYVVYQSVDSGTSWQKVASVTAPPAFVTVPGDKLVLFYVCGVTGAGEFCVTSKGAFYNGLWNFAATGVNVGP